jgi:phospholipase D1/2
VVPTDATPESPSGLPRAALLRFVVLALLVGGGFAALRWTPLAQYLDEQELIAFFERMRETWWAPLALIACYVVLCPLGVPATPMLLAGGVVFGTLLGGLYNLAGTTAAAALSFVLARGLAHGLVVHLLGERLRLAERAVARSGFWNLVRVRFLPLPFALVNYGAPLAGVRFGPYLASSALGLVAPSFLFAYFASSLVKAVGAERQGLALRLTLAILGLLALSLVPKLITSRARRRRYREITARRRGRDGS